MKIFWKKNRSGEANLTAGMVPAIVYFGLDLKSKALISSRNNAISVVTITMKRFKASIMDSWYNGVPPLSRKKSNQKKTRSFYDRVTSLYQANHFLHPSSQLGCKYYSTKSDLTRGGRQGDVSNDANRTPS